MERIACFGQDLTFNAVITQIAYRDKAIKEGQRRVASLYQRRGFKGRLSAKKKRWIFSEKRRMCRFQEENLFALRAIYWKCIQDNPDLTVWHFRPYQTACINQLRHPQTLFSHQRLHDLHFFSRSKQMRLAFIHEPVPKVVLTAFFAKHLPDVSFAEAKELLYGETTSLANLDKLLYNIGNFRCEGHRYYSHQTPLERTRNNCFGLILLHIIEHQLKKLSGKKSALYFHKLVSTYELRHDVVQKLFYESLSKELALFLFSHEVTSDHRRYNFFEEGFSSWEDLLKPDALDRIIYDAEKGRDPVGINYLSCRILRIVSPTREGLFKKEDLPEHINSKLRWTSSFTF
ncbi:MAG: hypothetical protein MRY21_04780 [Simkaniaceae bacterium]|nr:hypothetical protein [Simkaniaceae bacterium]